MWRICKVSIGSLFSYFFYKINQNIYIVVTTYYYTTSTITKEIQKMNTIYFKIENENCEETGYVEIYENDEYMPEFYYWNYNTGYQCQEFVEHKREEITGLTDEQINEIEEFKQLVNNNYVDKVLDFIFSADEGEINEMKIGELTVKVGDEF